MMKIGLMAEGELENISVPNNKKTKFGLWFKLTYNPIMFLLKVVIGLICLAIILQVGYGFMMNVLERGNF